MTLFRSALWGLLASLLVTAASWGQITPARVAIFTAPAAAASPAVAAGTWNPADKNTNIGLTNGNLTATISGSSGLAGVRSTTSHASGKWCFGVTTNGPTTSGSNVYIGVGKSTASLTTWVGGDANAWGWGNQGGAFFNAGSSLATLDTWPGATGQEQRVCVDLGAALIWLWSVKNSRWNASATADPATGTGGLTIGTGTFFAMGAINSNIAGGFLLADFAASGFTLPSGFSAWN